ncbi:MAG: acyltransferase [Acidimicrobiia bacterium]|nr:acyltransferase [Acidimicrobiia bacterium]
MADNARPRSARAALRDVWPNARSVVGARWYLRHATDIGPRVRVTGRPVVRNWGGTLTVGDRVQLISTITPIELAVTAGGTLAIGARTLVNYGTSIAASLEVRIGERCQLGTYTLLMDNDFHRLEPERRLERPESAPIIIGDDVWLAARVIVLPGVTIGEGSVIGAGSVVTRDIPTRSLAAGAPARVIRSL